MPEWFFFIPMMWILLAVAISKISRRINDKPIIPRLPGDARFAVRAASGRTLGNVITRIGDARNCLMVVAQAFYACRQVHPDRAR